MDEINFVKYSQPNEADFNINYLSRYRYIWAWCWSTSSVTREQVSVHIVHLEGCLWHIDHLHRKAGHSSINSFKLAQALVQIVVVFQHQSRRNLYQLKNLIPKMKAKLNCFSVLLSFAQWIMYNTEDFFLSGLSAAAYYLLIFFYPIIQTCINLHWILHVKGRVLFYIYLLKISTVFWNGSSLK